MSFTSFENRGLSGLANLGNTCFLNSCMQVLSHTYELNTFLDAESTLQHAKTDSIDSSLLLEWNLLRTTLWSRNCIVAPNRFLRTVQRVALKKDMPMFTGFSQNDLPEFLIFIISAFHDSLSRKISVKINGTVNTERDKIALKCFEMVQNMYAKDYSEINYLFFGIHVSLISSNKIIKSVRPEPFFIIDLPIPENNKFPSIYDCFDLYVKSEILDGDNAWYNEETKQKEVAKKKISFWSFPKILIVDFKRFNARNQKKQILIDFPLTNLDLSNYVIGYQKHSYKYDLYAVCNHSGGSLGGHYTSYIKNANGKWYHFNDTSVTEMPLQENQIVSPKAYCLFYRKRVL
jgi:ubiquitin C-terminal hydrolase